MITKEDRKKYEYHTEDSIYGIKLIGGVRNKVLLGIIKNGREDKYFKAIDTLMGGDTNPNWIEHRVAEEAYEREMIDEDKLDELVN